MVRDSLVSRRRVRARAATLAMIVAALATSACGIKGPLKPAPSTPNRPPATAVPAPNAPAPAQEAPPPVEPHVAPKS